MPINNKKFKDHQVFMEFLKDEKSEMERYKWIESEKAGKDLGQPIMIDWIKKYAASYRDWWESNHNQKIL